MRTGNPNVAKWLVDNSIHDLNIIAEKLIFIDLNLSETELKRNLRKVISHLLINKLELKLFWQNMRT